MLTPGHFYTMGIMKHPCGDRSWTHNVWEVLETNGTHAVVKAVGVRDYMFGYDPGIVLIAEFDWTPAGDLMKALAENACPDILPTENGPPG